MHYGTRTSTFWVVLLLEDCILLYSSHESSSFTMITSQTFYLRDIQKAENSKITISGDTTTRNVKNSAISSQEVTSLTMPI